MEGGAIVASRRRCAKGGMSYRLYSSTCRAGGATVQRLHGHVRRAGGIGVCRAGGFNVQGGAAIAVCIGREGSDFA